MKHLPFYIKYSSEKKGLVLADSIEIENIMNSKRLKANDEQLNEGILTCLSDGKELTRQELIDMLIEIMGASKRTMEDRLRNALETDFIFADKNSQSFKLIKGKNGKNVIYKLELIN